jgi:VWFA-related protein
MLRWSSFAAVLVLISTCLADNVTFLRIDKSVVNERVQKAPESSNQRVAALRSMFEKAGCAKSEIQVQPVPDQSLPNVLCTVPGTEYGTILITARLDYDGRGEEGTIGWGGVVMLPLLAESLTSTAHRHTLIFAAFSGNNAAGATYYWKNLTDVQRREFRGVVDLDHLGRTPAGFSTAANGAVMARLLPAAARALRMDVEPQPLEQSPESTAAFFQHTRVPAITIYSAGYASNTPPLQATPTNVNPLLAPDVHTAAASVPQAFALKTELDPTVYNQTYNLLCVYVLFLDRGLGASKHPASQTQVAKAAPPGTPNAPETGDGPPTVTPAQPVGLPSVLTTVNMPPPASSETTAPSVPQPANAITPNTAPSATIRVNTRLVQFDVVVTDNQGHPVKDLSASDFTVLQDGKPQSIRAFEFHTRAAANEAADNTSGSAAVKSAVATLPQNTFTNIPARAPQSSWTVVLFDLLNTGVSDQSYARNQLLQLLKSIPRGQPTALFVLTRNLEMLQGFTEDPQQLLESAELLNPGKSQILTTMVERERTISNIASTAQQAAPSINTGPTGPGGGFSSDSMVYSQAARISQGYNDHEAFRTTDRAIFTLAAMRGLAQAVSGYPGRKNLIWLSGSFPVQIEPDPASTDPFRNFRGFEDQIRTTDSLLATSRVAVYPVDVRGLQSKGIDISVATAENQMTNDVAPGVAHGVVAPSSSNLGATINAETISLADDRGTMMTMAEQTGGEAFVNTNDLKRVINRSLDDGATYYTLAYTPPKDDDTGGYHRVAVQVPNKKYKLAYRRGYYSIPQVTSGAAGTAALRAALQPGMPSATSMLLTASLELPDATRKDVKVNYVIDSNSVDFADAPDNKKHVQVDCMVIAFDSSGKEVGHASDTLDATIPPQAYAAVQAYGLPAHQLISLPPGKYNLRIGVMDKTTQQIGTVDAPLEVPSTSVAQR